MINGWFAEVGLSGWKAVIGALLLPPLPLIAFVLLGAIALHRRRRALGWTLLLLGCAGMYFLATPAAARILSSLLLHPPPALDASGIVSLHAARPNVLPTAIVVLGAGRRPSSPEYGMSNLKPATIERLRYALWLSRQTGWPVGYTGGLGYAAEPGPSEAEIASRIAANEFQHPLRWAEGRSRDTAENAALMVPMLRDAGVQRIVLVTHDYHQPRALRAFKSVATRIGWSVEFIPAPVGLHAPGPWEAGDFLPGGQAFLDSWLVLHEALGLLAGA
jgi:uncharacterized SAM-binding protein YcdF (DUF218 family)